MTTVSKDLAIKLREAGYPQEGKFWYRGYGKTRKDIEYELWMDKPMTGIEIYVSPTADEILDLLPKERYYTCVKTNTDRWRIAEFDQDGLAEEGKTSFIAESLADACALMYIFLKEQSLISQKEKK